MKLAQLYSLATGKKIKSQFLYEKFYPLKFDRYITIQAGSGMEAKNYSFFNEVIQLIKDILSKHQIEIVQLGGKEDIPLIGCHHLQGQTDLHQSNYVLARALAHLGNDSWLGHRAGELLIPLITLFGPTSENCHSAYRHNLKKTAFIESHRFGKNPSFSSFEQNKTINLIKPEVVANNLLKLLDIEERVKFETVYIGSDYNNYNQFGGYDNNGNLAEIAFEQDFLKAKGFQNIKQIKTNGLLEIVPNQVVDPNKFKGFSVNIRCDFYNDDKFLFENLKYHKATIIANSQLNLDILKMAKPQINEIKFEINDNIPVYWYKSLKKLGIKTIFFTKETNKEKIQKWRELYFDYFFFDTNTETTKADFLKSVQEYNNDKNFTVDIEKTKFKSNKLILSNNQTFLSKSHYLSDFSIEGNKPEAVLAIDTPQFWSEYQHFYFYV